jgi:hypothetical protein
VIAYERTLARARIAALPGETPRELLLRARGMALPPERLRDVEAATATHERLRYAGTRRT